MSALDDISNLTYNIYRAASIIVDSMDDHERVTVPELSNQIAESLKIDSKKVRLAVEFFVANHPNLVVSAGKFGGIFKNGRMRGTPIPKKREKDILEELDEIFGDNK